MIIEGMEVEVNTTYRGHDYAVTVHPKFGYRCGYIEAPEMNGKEIDEADDEITVHGGVTWLHDRFPFKPADSAVVGFDCGHWGDRRDFNLITDEEMKACQMGDLRKQTFTEGHLWTADEVEQECKNVIDQLIEARRRNCIYPIEDIAIWLIKYHFRMSKRWNVSSQMTYFQLTKLLYYAQGCSLALNNRPLFDSKFRINNSKEGVVPVEWFMFDRNSIFCGELVNKNKVSKEWPKLDGVTKDLLGEVYTEFIIYTDAGFLQLAYEESSYYSKKHNETDWLLYEGEVTEDEIKELFLKKYIEDDD